MLPILNNLKYQMNSLATCFKITRRDGTVLRFTDHDTPLVVDGQTYVPAAGVDASARQRQAELKDHNLDVRGIIDDDSITEPDLRAGRFRDAEVEELVVNWRFPWLGSLMRNVYWVGEVQYSIGTKRWEAELVGLSRWLDQEVGGHVGRLCPYELGDSDCKKNLADFTVAGSVTAIVGSSGRVFETTLANEDHYFDRGSLIFTSGGNTADGPFEIRNSLQAGGRIILWLQPPSAVQVGDTFTAVAGCRKTFSVCKNKFSNQINFGGHPHVPGNKKLVRVPDAHGF